MYHSLFSQYSAVGTKSGPVLQPWFGKKPAHQIFLQQTFSQTDYTMAENMS